MICPCQMDIRRRGDEKDNWRGWREGEGELIEKFDYYLCTLDKKKCQSELTYTFWGLLRWNNE